MLRLLDIEEREYRSSSRDFKDQFWLAQYRYEWHEKTDAHRFEQGSESHVAKQDGALDLFAVAENSPELLEKRHASVPAHLACS